MQVSAANHKSRKAYDTSPCPKSSAAPAERLLRCSEQSDQHSLQIILQPAPLSNSSLPSTVYCHFLLMLCCRRYQKRDGERLGRSSVDDGQGVGAFRRVVRSGDSYNRVRAVESAAGLKPHTIGVAVPHRSAEHRLNQLYNNRSTGFLQGTATRLGNWPVVGRWRYGIHRMPSAARVESSCCH